MKQLFLDIKTQLLAKVPEVTFVQMWNNQFNDLEEGSVYSFPFPCIFIEFVNENEIKQLGQGYQIYDPLTVRVHIGHDFYNNTDGTMEQDLAVMDLKQKVYKALQKFEPTGAVQFIRYSESQDYNHTNIYHFIQDYKTNYIDSYRTEPVDGVQSSAPIYLDLTTTYKTHPYTKKL